MSRALGRATVASMALLLAATLGACGRSDDAGDPAAASSTAATGAEAAAGLSPEELGALGARLDREPERATDLLAAEGLSWEAYELAVRRVSADADQARLYSEAFRAGRAGATGPS